MKDSMARLSIDELQRHVNRLEDQLLFLKDKREKLSVKNCPRCAHSVLAVYIMNESVFQCLTCGSKFTYKRTEQLVNDKNNKETEKDAN